MASTIPEQSFAVDSSAQEDTGFTLQSLKDHGSRDSFYMLLHDKVYDVTAFLDEVGFGLLHSCVQDTRVLLGEA